MVAQKLNKRLLPDADSPIERLVVRREHLIRGTGPPQRREQRSKRGTFRILFSTDEAEEDIRRSLLVRFLPHPHENSIFLPCTFLTRHRPRLGTGWHPKTRGDVLVILASHPVVSGQTESASVIEVKFPGGHAVACFKDRLSRFCVGDATHMKAPRDAKMTTNQTDGTFFMMILVWTKRLHLIALRSQRVLLFCWWIVWGWRVERVRYGQWDVVPHRKGLLKYILHAKT